MKQSSSLVERVELWPMWPGFVVLIDPDRKMDRSDAPVAVEFCKGAYVHVTSAFVGGEVRGYVRPEGTSDLHLRGGGAAPADWHSLDYAVAVALGATIKGAPLGPDASSVDSLSPEVQS